MKLYLFLVVSSVQASYKTRPPGTLDFVDWNCDFSPEWSSLRQGFEFECGHSRTITNLKCSSHITNWREHGLPFLAYDETFPEGCPLGELTILILNMLKTVEQRLEMGYQIMAQRIAERMQKFNYTTFMGTEWPVLALMTSIDWTAWPPIPAERDYDCVRSGSDLVNWHGFLATMTVGEDARISHNDIYQDSVRYVYNSQLNEQQTRCSQQCLYGLYTANVIKTLWSADTESSSWSSYDPYVSWVWYESPHFLGSSNWPLLELLHHGTSLKRHDFNIDFTQEELSLPLGDHGPYLQSLPLERHIDMIQMARGDFTQPLGGWLRNTTEHFLKKNYIYQNCVDVVIKGLRQAPVEHRFVYITMVYGNFNKYIQGWAERIKHLGITNLIMFCLDDEAMQICTEHHGELCVQGTASVFNKYTLLLVALQVGVDIMWLDFDMYLFQDPTPHIIQDSKGYEMLMAYAFESDCLCNAFFFMRSTPTMVTWIRDLIQWMYDNPFEHDQRAMAAYLNYTEKIWKPAEDFPELPKWFVFDVINKYTHWGPWHGSIDDIVLLHFMDGSAADLYGRGMKEDPSLQFRKKKSLMDVFYEEGIDHTRHPVEIDAVREGLDNQRKDDVPFVIGRQACGILPDTKTAHSGRGWLGNISYI